MSWTSSSWQHWGSNETRERSGWKTSSVGAAQIQRVNDSNGDHRVPGSHHSHDRGE